LALNADITVDNASWQVLEEGGISNGNPSAIDGSMIAIFQI